MIWKSKKDCFISLLICMGPWPFLFHDIAGLRNLKSTLSSGNGFLFSMTNSLMIHSPRCIVGCQSFCLVGQDLFVESTKNNFVLSDTKPNHIKTQKQIKITRYCQIRELKQDIRLVRSEESQICFQSWVTNACDPWSNQLECVASNENVASD